MAHRWTQEQLANELQKVVHDHRLITADYISTLERGVISWPGIPVHAALQTLFDASDEVGYSKPHVIEKKNSPRAASNVSEYVSYGRR